ncbi:MAG: hypothetical protein CMO55_01000 [Verrucomicrobiales bacterium]|nr:hypothetical protein [Verrucomicrobiales bacterium]
MNSVESHSKTITLLLILFCQCSQSKEPPKAFGTANHVIFLNMKGGMSQYETFNFHEDAYKGISDPPKSIPTSIEGLSICEWLPKTAALMDKCMLFRTVAGPPSHGDNVEQYSLHTGYTPRLTFRHPYIGSWCALQSEGQLPYYRLNGGCEKGSAFFPEHLAKPIVISNPNEAIDTMSRAKTWNRNSHLLGILNGQPSVMTRLFSDPEALECLNLAEEPDESRSLYGDHDFGKACLLARRLVENDKASFVEVALDGWDEDGENYLPAVKNLFGQLDDGFSALITDLDTRDLLDETLVVIRTDLGRHAYFHNGKRRLTTYFSPAVVAGGGIIPGKIIGETGKLGQNPVRPLISVKQFNGIIGRALRIDIHKNAYSPNGRPVTIGDSRDRLSTEVFR